MKSRLELFQKLISDRLKSDGHLCQAQICSCGLDGVGDFLKNDGILILVGVPIPIRVSKYNIGAMFSEISFQVKVNKAEISASTPSVVAVCERICKLLNGWETPAESGYGKINLAENTPWKIERADSNAAAVSISFNVQSMLQ